MGDPIIQKSLHAGAIGVNAENEIVAYYDGVQRLVTTKPEYGVKGGSGVEVVEISDGITNKSIFTFTDHAIAMVDEAGVVAYAGLKIYDFPEGVIQLVGTVADLDLTKSSAGINDTWDGDFALGTVTASNNGTLATTEQNIVPTTATPQAVSGVTTANGFSTATENANINGTTTAVDAYLNILIDDADHDVGATPANVIVNGTVTLVWRNLGDY